MTAKEYLLEVQRVQANVERKKDELTEYCHAATSAPSPRLALEKVQCSGSLDKVGDIVSKIADLETEVMGEEFEFVLLRHDVINQIQRVGNAKYMKLLYLRYVKGMPLLSVAKAMGANYDYVRKMHGKALKAFEVGNKGDSERRER